MRIRRATLVAITAVASAIAGCGNTPTVTTPPVPNENQTYIIAADSICRNGQAQLTSLGARPETLAALPDWLDKSAKQIQADVAALRALTPPAADAATASAMLRDLDEGIAGAQAVDAAARSGSLTAVDSAWNPMVQHYVDAGTAARSLGLVVCGQGASGTGRSGDSSTVVVTAAPDHPAISPRATP